MAVVDRKKVENVRYLFGSPSTVKSRYNQIKRTFPEGKEYLVFTEPVFIEDTNSILWSTEHQGSIINYQKLSPEDQSIAKRLLTKSIQVLLSAAEKYETDELTEFIYNCIEVPSMDNVFLVRSQGGDNVVISEWGFVSDAPGMEKGLLAKIISIIRVDMLFNVVYNDKTPAPNQKFLFEFEDQNQTHVSDVEAKIMLREVRVDEKVKAYQKDGEQIINEQSFVCYEAGRYTLIAKQYVDMLFKVVNQNNVPVSGETFTFDYRGQTVTLTADAEAKIILPQIGVGDDLIAFQTKEGNRCNDHNFICEKDKENLLRVEQEVPEIPPIPIDMSFKVLNQHDNIVPNKDFTFEFDGKTETFTSNSEGIISLPLVTAGSGIIAYQLIDDSKFNEHSFVAEPPVEGEAPKENILRVIEEAPPIYNMRFKVIDHRGEVVPNAKVKITYNNKTVEKFTDDEGYTILEDVEPQTQVKVIAIGKVKKK
jgi:hypothetical protein